MTNSVWQVAFHKFIESSTYQKKKLHNIKSNKKHEYLIIIIKIKQVIKTKCIGGLEKIKN